MSCMYEALAMTSQRPVVLLHNTTHVTNSDHVDKIGIDRKNPRFQKEAIAYISLPMAKAAMCEYLRLVQVAHG